MPGFSCLRRHWRRKLLLICVLFLAAIMMLTLKNWRWTFDVKGVSNSFVATAAAGVRDLHTDSFPLRAAYLSTLPGAKDNAFARRVVHRSVYHGKEQDSRVRTRRNAVREIMRQVWYNYTSHAFGANEYAPLSVTGKSSIGLLGQNIGAFVVDSLDTLYVMNLTAEFSQAKRWLQHNFKVSTKISLISEFVVFKFASLNRRKSCTRLRLVTVFSK